MPNGNQSDGGPKPAVPIPRLPTNLQLEQDDLVIFGEDGIFYLIQKDQYTSHLLHSHLMSAPEFAVGLGSMVSDVSAFLDWDDSKALMKRSACVVLNLAAIRQLNEKAEPDKPVTFLDDNGCTHTQEESAAPTNGHHHAGIDEELDKNDLVIFGTDKKFYWVKEKDYQMEKLPDVMRSAPELMVKMGTVLADIPNLPTAGCACYLLNLASIRKGSDYAARLLEENNLAERLRSNHKPIAAEAFSEKRKQREQYLATERSEAVSRVQKWKMILKPLDLKLWRKERKTLRKQDKAARRGRHGRIVGVVGLVGVVGVVRRSLFSTLRALQSQS